MWCYTSDPKKRWEVCDPEPLNCTTSGLGLGDPVPGEKKQCYFDADNYYNSATYKQDMEAIEAKDKAENAIRDAAAMKEKTEAAEQARIAAEAALKLAQEKAAREKKAAEAEAARNWYRDQNNALASEKAARDDAYNKNLAR